VKLRQPPIDSNTTSYLAITIINSNPFFLTLLSSFVLEQWLEEFYPP